MGAHQVFLQVHQFIVADADLCQLTESCIQSVDCLAASQHLFDVCIGLGDTRGGILADADSRWRLPGGTKLRK